MQELHLTFITWNRTEIKKRTHSGLTLSQCQGHLRLLLREILDFTYRYHLITLSLQEIARWWSCSSYYRRHLEQTMQNGGQPRYCFQLILLLQWCLDHDSFVCNRNIFAQQKWYSEPIFGQLPSFSSLNLASHGSDRMVGSKHRNDMQQTIHFW